MADYDNKNRGVLFRNERKTEEKHPEYRGNLNVGGVDFWIDAWVQTSKKDAKKFFSLKVKPKEEKPSEPVAASADDSLPF